MKNFYYTLDLDFAIWEIGICVGRENYWEQNDSNVRRVFGSFMQTSPTLKAI